MQRLNEIQAASVPPRETSVSLTTRSGKRLPPDSVKNLALLMAEAQAYFPNQSLPRGDTGGVPESVGGDRDDLWNSKVHGRTLEGVA